MRLSMAIDCEWTLKHSAVCLKVLAYLALSLAIFKQHI